MYIFTQKLCEIIPKHDDYLSQYGETWIQVYAFVCFEREGILPCCILGKIARDSLYIYTHTHDLGGGGFPRFTSSALFFLTHTQQNTHTQREGSWKLKTEKRNWEIPVLFVVKMKIRHVENQNR